MHAVSEASSQLPPVAANSPTRLIITAGSRTYRFSDCDAPVVVGREAPADVIIDDSHISRTHIRIDYTAAGWVAFDQSKNGMFVDGVRESTARIVDGLVIHLQSRGERPSSSALSMKQPNPTMTVTTTISIPKPPAQISPVSGLQSRPAAMNWD